MPLGVWFWVIYVLGVPLAGYGVYAPAAPGARFGGLVSIALFGILGWQVFGPVVHR